MSNIPQDIQQVLGTLLTALSSTDNTYRKQAENALNQDWSSKDKIDILLVFLAEQSCIGLDENTRAFAAVLFRRFAIKSPNYQGFSVTDRQIDHVSDAAKSEIRRILLDGFKSQQTKNVRHKLADAIAEVAKDEKTTWPDLLPTILQATQSSEPAMKESSFRMISTTPQIISNHDLNESFLKMFHSGFEDPSDDVRIATCTAFVAFFENLPKSTWSILSQLLPNLLNSLPRLLENGNDSALASVLESLIDLVILAPKIFKPMFETIIRFCSQVAQNKDLESNARLTALELLTSFSESSPNMCKREATYSTEIVIITLKLMTEVCIDDDDCAEWNNVEDPNEEGDEEEFNAARQSLDRVALKLSGQCLAGPLFQYLPHMLQSQDWHERQAALMALSSASEGCADVLISEIPKLLDMILPSLNDRQPRVQFSCCNALGQMSTDFATVIQISSGNRILPALISMLSTRNVPRVQTHAAAALVNFCEEANKEIIDPYLDDLLNNLLNLLKSSPKRYVQEQVITTIAVVADAAENKFIKYYDTLMPLLLTVMKSDVDHTNRSLVAKSIECATLIATAVGKEKFSESANQILEIFTFLQNNIQGEDDPVRPYLEKGWSRVCKLIGKNFLPFLPGVLPPLLEQAKATQDISIVDEDQLDEINQNEDYEVIQLSGKHIAVHTSVLDDKASAIEILKLYAEVLDSSFFPYVSEIANEIVIPGLDFYLHDGVRGTCAVTMPALLKCCIDSTGSSQTTESFALWKSMANKLIPQLESDPAVELFFAYYYALSKCLELMGPEALDDTQLINLAKSINGNLSDIYERINSRDDVDDDYNEEVAEYDDDCTDEELLEEVGKGITSVFENCGVRFITAFMELTPIINSFLSDENPILKRFSLQVVGDLIKYGGSESFKLHELFLNPIGEALSSSDSKVREAASRCVGYCTQSQSNEQYSQFCLACIPILSQMSSIPDARAPDNIDATEFMCSTLSLIIQGFHNRIPDVNQLITQWITLLPVCQNEEAAQISYNFLTQLINQQHPAVTTKISQVVDSVIQALLYTSISGDTAATTVASVKNLLATLPEDQRIALINGYSTEAKSVISKWFA
ncbi:hypothetical protein C6P42_002272 [Pichia californica]|nr:hypothetical protein C6P42_002272 [[Candida] californica]